MNILYIDTTDNDIAELVLAKSGKLVREKFMSMPHAEDFAMSCESFLKKQGLKVSDIDKIAVRVGPGFFSRIRSGVVVANALGFGLNVPIVAVEGEFGLLKIEKSKGSGMVTPKYGAAPNITKPKLRK